MEGGAKTTSGSQSGAGTADTNVKAGAAGRPGENQQVGVCATSLKNNTEQKDWTWTVHVMNFLTVVWDLRFQHEVSLLQQQLCESRELIHSLQSELQVYDRMCSSTKTNKGQYIL